MTGVTALLSENYRLGSHTITRQEALDLFGSDDLIAIGMKAGSVRRKWRPEGIVSYIIDRNINHTNFCTEYCSFCAFYRPLGHAEGICRASDQMPYVPETGSA